jgi:hypothetical protein
MSGGDADFSFLGSVTWFWALILYCIVTVSVIQALKIRNHTSRNPDRISLNDIVFCQVGAKSI